MKNKFIKITTTLLVCFNIMNVSAFADYTQSGTVNNDIKPVQKNFNGYNPNNNSSETSNPSSGGSSNTNTGKKGNVDYNVTPDWNIGSQSNPFYYYDRTPFDNISYAFNSFVNQSGSATEMYRGKINNDGLSCHYLPRAYSSKPWETWTYTYYSIVYFSRYKADRNAETNRVTDYWIWHFEGPDGSWTENGPRNMKRIFSTAGKYKVTCTPHQVVTTAYWSEYSCKAWDQYSNGHQEVIKSYYNESPKTYEKTNVTRFDLAKTWEFELTPEEIGYEITIPDYSVIITDIDVDAELIE